MTITLSSFANMKVMFEALPVGPTKDHALSILEVARWQFESEETGDMVLGRWIIGGVAHVMHIDVSEEGSPRQRVYRVVINPGDIYWDFADQQIREAVGRLSGGKNLEILKEDAIITGGIVVALNEVEKARAAVEALIP